MTPRIRLTNTVKINGGHFDERIVRMLWAARDAAPQFTDGTLWVTSANDSAHMKGSRHFTNEAFDLRTRNVRGGPKEVEAWTQRIKAKLGAGYDVVNEGDHLHLEFDPK